MKTTFYERTTSMLIALLLLGGAVVAIMLGLWLSAQVLARPVAVPVTLVPRGDGAGDEAAEEDPNVLEPGPEFVQEESTMLEPLETVVDIVSKNAAIFSETAPMDDSLLAGGKSGDGRTRGKGLGLAGPVRRWEFNFDRAVGVAEYAKMLDFFGIELGVLQPGGKVIYVAQLGETYRSRGADHGRKAVLHDLAQGGPRRSRARIASKGGGGPSRTFHLKISSTDS